MTKVQILACSDVLGTCCSDYALVTMLDIVRKFFDVLQILVPIILILMTIIQMLKLTVNPELKNGTKKVITNIIATVIIFFLPTIVDTVMGILPSSEYFQVSACWNVAKNYAEVVASQETKYVATEKEEKKSSILIDPEDYDEATGTTLDEGGGSTGSTGNSSSNNPTGAAYDPSQANGSALGKQIVAYAMQFVGGAYVLEGQWDGEIPYTPTCCAGFVSGVYRHFGFKIYSTWNGYYVPNIWSATDKYTVVTDGSIKAGDLVIYSNNSHVAMLTGVGNQIVHAANSRDGVKVSDNYNYSNNVKAIIRINGVN